MPDYKTAIIKLQLGLKQLHQVWNYCRLPPYMKIQKLFMNTNFQYYTLINTYTGFYI